MADEERIIRVRIVGDAGPLKKAGRDGFSDVEKASKKASASVAKTAGDWGFAMGKGFLVAGRAAMKGAQIIGQASKAVVDFIADASDLKRELDPFFARGLLPEVSTKTIDEASSSMRAMGTAASGVGLAMVQEFSPAIKNGAVLVVALTLSISDFVKRAAEEVHNLAEKYRALSTPAQIALGIATAGTTDLILALDKLQSGYQGADMIAGEYLDQARKLVGEQERVDDATRGATAAAKAQAEAQKKAAEEQKRQEGLYKEFWQNQIDRTKAAEDGIDEWVGKWQEAGEAIAAAIEQVNENQAQMRDAIADTFGSISDLSGTLATTMAANGNKGATAVFRLSQAAALAQIGMATRKGVMEAWANPFLILPGAKAATITAIIAAGAANAAAVAAQKPPGMYRGGFPDEVPITAHRNEAVLSQQGRQALGDDTIRRAQAGQSPAPIRVVSVNQYRHQVFERFIKDNLKMGGALPKAINGSTIVGHRTNRKGTSV